VFLTYITHTHTHTVTLYCPYMYTGLSNVYTVHLILDYSFYTDSVNKFIVKFEIP